MPRFALLLVGVGLFAILATVLLVLGDATLPGRVSLLAAAGLAGFGGLALVVGLWMLEPRGQRVGGGSQIN
ncbi:hypothetical protein [Falsiroseomonas selenitidurans]|uniref:Uncharacterized protein n=1 Tax=Falsiroseomonas selenitidurans TaxID=2716335 RepID=A0ABX1EA21_9PROT|nr:hypothetical protein [Falsiroseomonas selenitidurans]NKC33660.1 hypothetical protein [Falsiroseomonas selenitidurans]OYW08875.1 MAG: hypothetical protein B7Z53_04015 [Rhodospirillales bacterium 12-71-4]